jgi:hypothetical protein
MSGDGSHDRLPSNRSDRLRTAVIAIHGVGEHRPGETAQGVARLLQSVNPRRYRDLVETSFSLPVTPGDLAIPRQVAPNARGVERLRRGFQSVFHDRYRAQKISEPLDIAFSRSLLANGEAYASVYNTVALHGRCGDDREPPRAVEIFELYWSDLSHYGRTLAALFGAIFQLVVHAASLGRTSTATTLPTIDPTLQRPWRAFYQLNALSYWLLSMPILIGNMLLALTALLFIPALLSRFADISTQPATQHPAQLALYAAGIAASIVACAWALIALRRRASAPSPQNDAVKPVAASFVAGLAAALVVVFAYLAIQGFANNFGPAILAALELPLLFLLGEAAARRYDQSRPGALVVWRIMGGAYAAWIAGVGAAFWISPQLQRLSGDPSSLLMQWLGHGAEGLFVVLVAAWLALYVSNFGLLAVSFILKRQISARPDISKIGQDAARRAVNTALMSACFPATFFLAVVLSIWAAAAVTFQSEIPPEEFTPWFKIVFQSSQAAGKFIDSMIDESAGVLFFPFVALMIGAGALALWGFLPSILREIFPGSVAAKSSSKSDSIRLGAWLDGGFVTLGYACVIAAFAFFFLFPLGSSVTLLHNLGWMPARWTSLIQRWLDDPARYPVSFVTWTSYFVSASALGLFGAAKLFAGGVSQAFDQARVAIDVALDVDNWLRERPIGETPRLKIFARFASLLERVADAGGCDQIVLVAHSQGTVIAADFFRYLRAADSALLKRLPPVVMFSAGSPLRQLYALRFPALYEWVRRPPFNVHGEPGPDVAACGFSLWVNAYASGDYVGRYLWAPDDSPTRWDPGALVVAPPSAKAEFCIGAGAHTHYFDDDSATVGRALDSLIGG